MSETQLESSLVKQVEVLSQTVQAQTARLDQQSKLFDELTQRFNQLAEKQQEAIRENLILNEALKRSLSESDRAVDDLGVLVLALQTLQKQHETELQRLEALKE